MDKKLIGLISDAFGADSGDLESDIKLMDMAEWDSLRHMEFILVLESEFNIQLTGDEIASMETIGQVQCTVDHKLKQE